MRKNRHYQRYFHTRAARSQSTTQKGWLPMLTAQAICKKYVKHTVLDRVSLQAQGGEAIGIAGVNGSGKSTLLSVLTGIVRPDSGQVWLEGQPLSPGSLQKWVGYVPQENALFDGLSALDNIKLWASAYKADWRNALPFLFAENEKEGEARAFLRKKAGKLSGGMKKRLSIAIALFHDPLYLLMDEPTAGLDVGFRWHVTQTINQLRERGKCVIFTSHQADELSLCDRIYVLRDGVFAYEGDAQILAGGTQALYALISGDASPGGAALC
jgi:ABC-2 type transport system ATP-binding protein